jgi:phosphatidylglycerol:prolipoprotein diacylglycerol transferase
MPLSIGYAIGRLGCFFNGCCWGREADVVWAVRTRFADGLRHPVQIYDSLLTLGLFGFIYWRGKSTKFGGQLFLETLMGFAVVRFIVEFFRDTPMATEVLSLTQTYMFILFAIPLIIEIYNLRKGKKLEQNDLRKSSQKS